MCHVRSGNSGQTSFTFCMQTSEEKRNKGRGIARCSVEGTCENKAKEQHALKKKQPPYWLIFLISDLWYPSYWPSSGRCWAVPVWIRRVWALMGWEGHDMPWSNEDWTLAPGSLTWGLLSSTNIQDIWGISRLLWVCLRSMNLFHPILVKKSRIDILGRTRKLTWWCHQPWSRPFQGSLGAPVRIRVCPFGGMGSFL